jgi:hypothetical protein
MLFNVVLLKLVYFLEVLRSCKMSTFSTQLMARAKSGQLGQEISASVRADYARAGVVYKPTLLELEIKQRRAALEKVAAPKQQPAQLSRAA